ncbi:MAG: DUF2093 domain-containing protein [Novosphingobium sp.]
MLMSPADKPATLHYQPSGFRVIAAGSHVLCAVTGERIELEALRYWCVDRQEAYASCAIAVRRLMGQA